MTRPQHLHTHGHTAHRPLPTIHRRYYGLMVAATASGLGLGASPLGRPSTLRPT